MHERQTIVTDISGVCSSVCRSVCHAESFCAAFAKLLWPFVTITNNVQLYNVHVHLYVHATKYQLNSVAQRRRGISAVFLCRPVYECM